MPKLTLRAGSTVAMAALVASLGAIVGVVACSFIVSDTPTAYTCQPGAGPLVCPANQVCAPNATGTQYSCATRCTATSCTGRLVCDSVTGWCVAPDAGNEMMMVGDDAPMSTGNMDATTHADGDAGAMTQDADAATGEAGPCNDFGCGCASSSDCAPGFACVGRLATTADIWKAWIDAGGRGSGDGGICMEPCCISNECDTSDAAGGTAVCFATGAGGNYCVPPAWLGDRSTIGMELGGTACADDAGTACRSGLCVSGVCADTCCSNRLTTVECAGSSICRFGTFPGSGFDTHEAANCAQPTTGARGSNGSSCAANSECRSNLCAGSDGGGPFGDMPTCRDACRTGADCTTSTRSTQSCAYLQSSTDLVAACMPTSRGAGDAGAGSPCQSSSDCARGYCAPLGNGQSACVATCFTDRTGVDCLPTERCRPQPLQVGNAIYSVLACGM